MNVRRRALAAAALLASTTLALAACGSDADESPSSSPSTTTSAEEAAFPVTIEHAYGETTIESKPERVATVNWSNHDVALALGVVPVGMPKQTYGDDDGDGLLPWTAEKLDELGATGANAPALFDETDSLDLEGIAAAEPDVILAAYSGITQEEYDTLSKIAPTVAFPTTAWGTPWRDTIRIDAKALGLAAEGDALIADIESTLDDAMAAHPSAAGKTAMFAYFDPADLSTIGYYTTADARVSYLEDLGLTMPASVTGLSEGADSFYGSVSAENADTFDDVAIIFTYGDASLLAAMQADPLLGTIPAIKNGAVVMLTDGSPLAAAVSPPTALSATWSIDQYAPLIGAAADKVR